jgi:hypothetical protein
MTIKVVVKNDDTRENAIIAVDVVSDGGSQSCRELKGGESGEFYIHSGNTIVINEIQNG